jgi:PPOX class probable FMN-dependent enzyme
MTLAPWRTPLARALHRNRSDADSRYFQIATVRPDGRPANRTVVFREFLDGCDRIQFVTDTRSEKIDQIQHQTWGEICWYFIKTREQFRLTGTLTLVMANHEDEELLKARKTVWHNLSDKGRLQFVWPHPGKPRAEKSAFEVPPPAANDPVPDNFCLTLLEPTLVYHLELRGDPQNRYQYQWHEQEGWQMQEVNP